MASIDHFNLRLPLLSHAKFPGSPPRKVDDCSGSCGSAIRDTKVHGAIVREIRHAYLGSNRVGAVCGDHLVMAEGFPSCGLPALEHPRVHCSGAGLRLSSRNLPAWRSPSAGPHPRKSPMQSTRKGFAMLLICLYLQLR
jgi:hypothetical protein